MSLDKFYIAVKTLNADANFSYDGEAPTNETEFNKIKWITNGTSTSEAIYGDAPSGINWTAVKTEMDSL